MKAIVFHRHGGPEVLRYEEMPTPHPSRHEVLIAVRALSVNRGLDIETRERGLGKGQISMPHISGSDPSGDIVSRGSGVTDFAVGDRVVVYPLVPCGKCDFCEARAGENACRASRLFGVLTQGGRAEYAAVPASQLVLLPDTVTYETAAALAVAYTTAWHGLTDRAQITSNDTLLVVGAGGALGVAAVQLGVLLGSRVLAVTGADWKRARLLELGAEQVFSYRDHDWVSAVRAATGGRGVSVAFDNAGQATFAKTIECLDRRGRLICAGGTTGFDVQIDLRRLYRQHVSLIFYTLGTKANLEHLVGLVAAGRLAPTVDRTFPLASAADADRHLSAGHQFGRVVLTQEARSW